MEPQRCVPGGSWRCFSRSGERQGAHLPSTGYRAGAGLPVGRHSVPTETARQLTASAEGRNRRAPERCDQRPDRAVPDLHLWSPSGPSLQSHSGGKETEDSLSRAPISISTNSVASPEQWQQGGRGGGWSLRLGPGAEPPPPCTTGPGPSARSERGLTGSAAGSGCRARAECPRMGSAPCPAPSLRSGPGPRLRDRGRCSG